MLYSTLPDAIAEATAGEISNWMKIELKMTPGPTPDIAAKKAAKKATITSLVIFLGLKSWSPLVN